MPSHIRKSQARRGRRLRGLPGVSNCGRGGSPREVALAPRRVTGVGSTRPGRRRRGDLREGLLSRPKGTISNFGYNFPFTSEFFFPGGFSPLDACGGGGSKASDTARRSLAGSFSRPASCSRRQRRPGWSAHGASGKCRPPVWELNSPLLTHCSALTHRDGEWGSSSAAFHRQRGHIPFQQSLWP